MTEKKSDVKKTDNKVENKPSWMKMKSVDLEKIIVDLAKKGENPAKIGLMLRDIYGVPRARLLGKRITHILRENGIEFKGKKEIFEERITRLRTHLAKNKHDYPVARAITKKLWVVHKLESNKIEN